MTTPDSIRFHAASGALELHWPDGRAARLEGPALRAACKCAECEQQRRGGQAPGTLPSTSTSTSTSIDTGSALLRELQPVGGHGLALAFSDGHARGIYPWSHLRALADMSASP